MKKIKIVSLAVALMCIAAVAVFSGCVEPPQKHECPVCQVCPACQDCDRAVSAAKQSDLRAMSELIGKAAQRYYEASQKACDQGDYEAYERLYKKRHLALMSLAGNLWVQCQDEGSAGCKASWDDLVALLTADLAPASDQPGDQLPEEELGEPAEDESAGGPPRAAQ